jgi:hypothetical protein
MLNKIFTKRTKRPKKERVGSLESYKEAGFGFVTGFGRRHRYFLP